MDLSITAVEGKYANDIAGAVVIIQAGVAWATQNFLCCGSLKTSVVENLKIQHTLMNWLNGIGRLEEFVRQHGKIPEIEEFWKQLEDCGVRQLDKKGKRQLIKHVLED